MKVKTQSETEIKTLVAKCGVRYWEDATVNGVDDESGTLIPCRNGNYWCPEIDIETGTIINWKQGTTADIHYKVCDDGEYSLKDENGKTVVAIDDYVPKIMCPGDTGYGDYVIMKVDENGKIENFKPSFEEFESEK